MKIDNTIPKKQNNLKWLLYDIASTLLWIYIIIKLFFFDIERHVFDKLNLGGNWLLNYRIIIYLFLISIIWYLVGHKRFWLSTAYIIFFPFIVVLWKIPKIFLWKIPKLMYLNKSWVIMYAYLNAWINAIYLFRSNIFKFTLFSIAVLFLIYQDDKTWLGASSIIFFGLLVTHISSRFKLAFSPIRMFRVNLHLLSIKNSNRNDFADNLLNQYNKFLEKYEEDVEKIEKQKTQTMEQLVMSHQFMNFISNRLQEFKRMRIYMAASSIKVIYTFFYSLTLITLLNYSVFHLDPSTYKVLGAVGFFEFFYYTFHSMLLSSISMIEPASGLALAINMLAPFTGILITIFLITLYFSVKSERYKENVDEVIEFANAYATKVEQVLLQTFDQSVFDALMLLKKKKSSVYGLFFNNDLKSISGDDNNVSQ